VSLVLVDTSVWIDVFRRRRPLDIEVYVDLDDVVTCLPVVQEVLQGFRDEDAYRTAREAMLHFPMVESPLSAALFEEAVLLWRTARRLGVAVRSPTDCVIAACALRHNLKVLHRERDFAGLARISRLRHWSI
jgi:predicted nucleic acid-binding protein